MKIKIVTDSTADLSKEDVDRYGITVIPIQYTMEGKTYRDQIDITTSEFIEKMSLSKELPKTSQPSLGTFLDIFRKLTQDGSEVLAIHVAANLSGTFQTAQMAAKQCEGKVSVFDSMFITKALGFQVLEAAQMAHEGKSLKEIQNRLNEVLTNTRLYVALDTLENLIKGGRIGRGKGLIGSLLNIKPIAAIEDGYFTPKQSVRSYGQVIKHLVRHFREDVEGKVIRKVAIIHADALELAERLREKILENYENIEIKISETTPAIITHAGRGAVGLAFYTD